MGPEQRYAFTRPLCFISALLCLLVIGSIWLIVLQRIDTERERAVEAAMRANSNLSMAFEQNIFRTLKAAEQVAAFAREGYLQHGTPPDLHHWVQNHVIREDIFTIVSLVDEHGTILASTQETAPNVNYADREFFLAQRRTASDTLYISRPVLGRISKAWRIPLSLRIPCLDGSFGGVVVMAIDPAHLTNFYQESELNTSDLLEVTGLDGYTRGRKIGRQTSFNQDARTLPWFIRHNTAPTGTFVDDGEIDGIRRIVSYRGLSGYPLIVTVGTAYDEAIAPSLQRRTTYLLTTSVISMLVLLSTTGMILGVARQQAITLALEASRRELTHAAQHDALTGLPNRILFHERCLRALESARRHNTLVAILYLDLDGFKEVNDQNGHVTGDELLQQVAKRLTRHTRATSEDTVARLGGDEFAIMLNGLSSKEDGERIILAILAALARPYILSGTEVQISASIGAVLYPQHGTDLDTLIGRADTAMYATKHAGKNQFLWWTDPSQTA